MAGHVPVVPMDRGNNTTCTINLHGATIVSWRVNNQARDSAVVGLKMVKIGPILAVIEWNSTA